MSAYSLIAACKVSGVNSTSIKEIIGAHAALGRGVTSSSIIQLTLFSPVRTYAPTPEEYLNKVLGQLSMNLHLGEQLRAAGVRLAGYMQELREAALEVLGMLEEARDGRRPDAFAASAAYSAETVLSRCQGRSRWISQRELAECSASAEYTIREQCAGVFLRIVDAVVARRRKGGRADRLRKTGGSDLFTTAVQ